MTFSRGNAKDNTSACRAGATAYKYRNRNEFHALHARRDTPRLAETGAMTMLPAPGVDQQTSNYVFRPQAAGTRGS
jgi:hypothetical protein